MSPRSLTRGYKSAWSQAGADLAKKHIPKLKEFKGSDIISEAEEILNKQLTPPAKESWVTEPGFMLRQTDDFNRRTVFLSALEQKGWLQKGLAGQEIPKDVVDWAISKMRRTQGDPGALGKNPFHRGPIAGPIAAFQKYPGLFIENMADAFNDPEARGRAAVASLLGLAAMGQLLGIDVAEMYASGARPLGIDPLHPGDTLARGLGMFPATRAIGDVIKHATGTATHPFIGTPGTDFLEGDVATLAFGRYPVKALTKIGEVSREGLGKHEPESETDTRVPHTGFEDLESLVGLKSTAMTSATKAARDASRFREKAIQETRESSREKRRALDRAIRDGNQSERLRIEREMTPAQKREFYRRRKQTPYERRREQIPRNRREEFDERFRERLDR